MSARPVRGAKHSDSPQKLTKKYRDMLYPELHFTGQVWRPPYEAGSQLLQLTSGCTWHKCKFCSLYHGTPFRMSPLSEVEEDLKFSNQWLLTTDSTYYLCCCKCQGESHICDSPLAYIFRPLYYWKLPKSPD